MSGIIYTEQRARPERLKGSKKMKKVKVIDLAAVPFAKVYEFNTIEEANAFIATHKYARVQEGE